jgi:hypothetical protein
MGPVRASGIIGMRGGASLTMCASMGILVIGGGIGYWKIWVSMLLPLKGLSEGASITR